MKLHKVQNPQKYVGLYVVDFGEHSGTGFTAQEVAELLESERFKHIKIYKIHNAYPDGRMELKGVPKQTFEIEKGMFFYSSDLESAQVNFKQLVNLAVKLAPPARAKVHLAGYGDDRFVTALIYPAEYDDQFSRWLIDGGYKTAGAAEGGIEVVQRYYDQRPQVLDRHQLFSQPAYQSRTGEQLLASVKLSVQR
ncbi:MAG TPA: hypothetical protein HPP87_09065 [Planctomycetes bacterium]|nr:hypothetical protein [Planctomycetota bacterium]